MMRTPLKYVAPLALALWLFAGAAPLLASQRRAPRDRGGTALLLEVKAEGAQAPGVVERTAAVIRKRCARLGVYCRVGPQTGGAANRLALRFSTASDAGRVKEVLLAQGVELRAVVSVPYPAPMAEYETRSAAEAEAKDGMVVVPLRGSGGPEAHVVTEGAPVVTGDDLRDPYVLRAPRETPGGGYVVDSRLRPAGAARLKAWTRANIGRYAVVVYNGRALEAVYVKAPIVYNVVVSGGFDRRQALDVAAVLAGGNLPAPVEVLEEGTYKP
jgi:preprotein translocase subunit SecD